MYLTLQDVTKLIIESNAPATINDIIWENIHEDEGSALKAAMAEGVGYYGAEHDIEDLDFRKYVNKDGVIKTQKNKANNHLVHPYHRRQVIEKVSYLLKQPPSWTHEDKSLAEEYTEILGTDFDDLLIDWATDASNKGVEYLHPYVKGNIFNPVIIDAEQCIPIYDTAFQKELVQLIRYYKIKVNEAGQEHDRYKVEWYYPDKVEIYQEQKDGKFALEDSKTHFMMYNSKNKAATLKGQSWGRVPFIELRNNTNKYTDLRFIKSLIDDYDRGASDFSNNLEDIQEAIITATGCNIDPAELRDKLRQFKVIVANEVESKIDKLTIEIPYEARMAQLKNNEENIHTFGMSINPKTDEFGNDPSGVALQWLYMPLDLKAGMLERKLEKALYELFWFVGEYRRLTQKKNDDISKFSFTFNKTMIANRTEQINNAVVSKGFTSDETALSMHPEVDDVEVEMEKIEEDRAREPKIDLGDEEE